MVSLASSYLLSRTSLLPLITFPMALTPDTKEDFVLISPPKELFILTCETEYVSKISAEVVAPAACKLFANV